LSGQKGKGERKGGDAQEGGRESELAIRALSMIEKEGGAEKGARQSVFPPWKKGKKKREKGEKKKEGNGFGLARL